VRKLSSKYKEHLRLFLRKSCEGTPLQEQAAFVSGYLTAILVGQIEYLDEIEEDLQKED
jgi:hypothetical protein